MVFPLFSKLKEGILVAPYWNLNVYFKGRYIENTNILVAPYWNLNQLTEQSSGK